MKDYRLEMRLRNNRILRAIEDAGYASQSEFCRVHNFSAVQMSNLVTMRMSAIGASGEWKPSAKKLADALGCAPEDLFNERQKHGSVASPTKSIEMDEEDIRALLPAPADPEKELLRNEALRLTDNALSSLSPREREVLVLRFGLNGEDPETLDNVGSRLDLSPERIRQIEGKALQRLKRPHHWAGYTADDLAA